MTSCLFPKPEGFYTSTLDKLNTFVSQEKSGCLAKTLHVLTSRIAVFGSLLFLSLISPVLALIALCKRECKNSISHLTHLITLPFVALIALIAPTTILNTLTATNQPSGPGAGRRSPPLPGSPTPPGSRPLSSSTTPFGDPPVKSSSSTRLSPSSGDPIDAIFNGNFNPVFEAVQQKMGWDDETFNGYGQSISTMTKRDTHVLLEDAVKQFCVNPRDRTLVDVVNGAWDPMQLPPQYIISFKYAFAYVYQRVLMACRNGETEIVFDYSNPVFQHVISNIKYVSPPNASGVSYDYPWMTLIMNGLCALGIFSNYDGTDIVRISSARILRDPDSVSIEDAFNPRREDPDFSRPYAPAQGITNQLIGPSVPSELMDAGVIFLSHEKRSDPPIDTEMSMYAHAHLINRYTKDPLAASPVYDQHAPTQISPAMAFTYVVHRLKEAQKKGQTQVVFENDLSKDPVFATLYNSYKREESLFHRILRRLHIQGYISNVFVNDTQITLISTPRVTELKTN